MTYRIEGLDPARFAPLFALSDEALAARGAVRRMAEDSTSFPCRVSLVEAKEGEPLILLPHVSNDAAGPFRISHAIFVRAAAREAARFVDSVPQLVTRRTVGLRAFDGEGMLRAARLAGPEPGAAEAGLAALFGMPEIAKVHIHNAALGCFLAEAVRD